MTQYPHYLFEAKLSDGYQDDSGNYVSDDDNINISYLHKCRYEIDGKGTRLELDSNTHIVISGCVYCATSNVKYETDQIIVVARDIVANDIIAKLKVVNVEYGRLHTRIWVSQC